MGKMEQRVRKALPVPPENFVFVQAVPSDTWGITHTLNKHPAVHVEDSAHSVVEGTVTYLTDSSLMISFSAPFSGTAILN